MSAQELACEVEINASQVEGTSRQVFETLQQAIADYMNTTRFGQAIYAPNEKVDCRLYFTIKEYDGDKMTGDLQVQSTRPVFNSTYTTTLLNFKDTKIEFTYQENEPLIYSTNNMESQLTAILNYYACLILALDSDSFAPRGGDEYYDRLNRIVQIAQSSGESGWRAFEDTRNRSAILSVFTDKATSGVRDMLYQYHLRGLDAMALTPDKGRAEITSSLQAVKDVYDVAPMSVGLALFKDAKLDELVNIYSQAPESERRAVADILRPVYPAEKERIEKIITPDQTR